MIYYTEKELKSMLRDELRRYETTIGPMTEEERKELREWVKGGNSPYDNPFCMSDDYGYPSDYITAIRDNEALRDTQDDQEDYQTDSEPAFGACELSKY